MTERVKTYAERESEILADPERRKRIEDEARELLRPEHIRTLHSPDNVEFITHPVHEELAELEAADRMEEDQRDFDSECDRG